MAHAYEYMHESSAAVDSARKAIDIVRRFPNERRLNSETMLRFGSAIALTNPEVGIARLQDGLLASSGMKVQ
jgi:hypothetical protein